MPADPATLPLAGIGDEAGTTLPEQIAAVARLGWSGIELRTVDGIPLSALSDQAFGEVHRAIRDAGLTVTCLASRIGSWARPITAPWDEELDELDILAERAHTLGTGFIRVMSYPNDRLDEHDWQERVLDRMARLAGRASSHGITLVHENCSGWAGADPDRMLLLTEAGGTALRLLFDTGNGVAHGYDSLAMLRRILPRVAHVHVKDAVGTPERPKYVPPGDGQARVAECLRLLLEHGYDGALSLEPHLATRPHEGVTANDSIEPFVHAGQRLQQILSQLSPAHDPLPSRCC